MLIMTVMGIINMSRQFFNVLVGIGSRSHDFDDGIFCTLSGNLERIVSILSTKYLEKRSQSDFTDVNSGRAGGGILCRMLFIKFQRRRGLSEFSAITSA